MGAILGSRVKSGNGWGKGGGVVRQAWINETAEGRWGENREGQRETGGIWEVTVNKHARHYHHTINTVRHIYAVRGCEPKQRRKKSRAGRGGEEGEGRGDGGQGWMGTRQTGNPLTAVLSQSVSVINFKFFQ